MIASGLCEKYTGSGVHIEAWAHGGRILFKLMLAGEMLTARVLRIEVLSQRTDDRGLPDGDVYAVYERTLSVPAAKNSDPQHLQCWLPGWL